MTDFGLISLPSLLRHGLETFFSAITHPLAALEHRWRHARRTWMNHKQRPHFGSLDDQVLDDLGLQRSELIAAEYGILPADQALHCPAGDDNRLPTQA